MWKSNITVTEVKEIRGRSTIYLGAGAITKIVDIADELKNRGITRVLLVTGKGSYQKSGAWGQIQPALQSNNIAYALYDQVTPNPNVDQVDEAARLALDFGAQAVIAVGGGSAIDTGKSAAILLSYPEKNARDIFEFKFTPEKAAPIIVVNLTHGTGSEADRMAVVSIPEKNYKPAIAYDCIYPLYSIDDPALMVNLPSDQTCYVSVDAVNHAIEAATTILASPYSILLSKETVLLVAKYLPQALANSEDLTARYYLTYASLIAGISFDNSLLHITHALEHPLSAVKTDLAHGLGLGILLPAIINHIYPGAGGSLAYVLSPIVPDLTGAPSEADKAARGMEMWLKSVGITEKLSNIGFQEEQLPILTDLVYDTPGLAQLLSLAPVDTNKDTVISIYRESF
ncbi:MAG: iron-containing alcohol dehydrogenase [Desulfotomaculaceae bacterium]|nr:iron-containing alcohol dehydrogenase [Desulfotomaculaceae bacterium]